MVTATDRQRHAEKITVYCNTDLVVALSDALNALRRKSVKVDRGRFIREAVAYVLDLDAEGKAAFVERLARPDLLK